MMTVEISCIKSVGLVKKPFQSTSIDNKVVPLTYKTYNVGK